MKRDAGFTLAELLLGMLIMTAVIGVIAQCFVLGLRTTDATTSRFAESRDSQLFSSYFATDVESAQTILSSPQCSPGGAHLLSLTWADEQTDGTQISNSVSYYTVTAGTETQLIRRACRAGVTTESILVHGLRPTTPVAVGCDGGVCAVGASTPRRVTFTVNEPNYSFAVTGSRRTT